MNANVIAGPWNWSLEYKDCSSTNRRQSPIYLDTHDALTDPFLDEIKLVTDAASSGDDVMNYINDGNAGIL